MPGISLKKRNLLIVVVLLLTLLLIGIVIVAYNNKIKRMEKKIQQQHLSQKILSENQNKYNETVIIKNSKQLF